MTFIKKLLNLFWSFHKGVVLKNSKYKDIHKGQTCLIFGNGGSLKFYDMSALRNYPSIGCSYSLTDRRLAALEMTYCVMSDTYLLYFIRKDSYRNLVAVNLIGPVLKKIIKTNPRTQFFTSLTNYYAFWRRPKNLGYFHHFGDKTSGSYDLAAKFATCAGALDLMIGLAKYLGFSKVILLGCDYLGSPKLEGHFYSDAKPFAGKDAPQYTDRIKEVADGLDVLAIFPDGISCPIFKSATYSEYFGAPEVYQSNIDIVAADYLSMMRKAALKKPKQIWM